MNFKMFTSAMASILHGPGVFVICVVIAVIFYTLYLRTNSRQLLNSLPGLFTSLGLLGTFAAICNSLGDISEDNLQVTKIIEDLVPAFTSSIAGLICAFIATAWCKIFYSNQDRAVENKIKKKSPEECLLEIAKYTQKLDKSVEGVVQLLLGITKYTQKLDGRLENVEQLLIKQSTKNEEYNTKLTSTISSQSLIMENFIEGFVNRMDSIFVKMNGQIEQNIKSFGQEQFQKSAAVLENLTTNLNELSSQLLSSQTSNVEQMIENTNTELKVVSDVVSTQMDKLCSQMTNALSNIGSNQNEQLTSIIQNYDVLSTRLSGQNGEFAEKMMAQMNDEYSKIQNQNVENVQQMLDLKEAFTEVNTEIIQSTNRMNKEVSSELTNSLSSFVSELQSSISSEISVLSGMIQTNVESLQQSYSYISDHVANIKGNYESSAQAYIDAVNNAHRTNESQEKMLDTISVSMGAVAKTNEKVDATIYILEERQERIENLLAHIQEISTTIATLQKLENQLNRLAS